MSIDDQLKINKSLIKINRDAASLLAKISCWGSADPENIENDVKEVLPFLEKYVMDIRSIIGADNPETFEIT
nr:hypothetical protein [uncultured Cohaesibacter sp.]